MTDAREVRDIPIERIDILNPRARNQKIFCELVASIECLGLKKPITVTPRGDGGEGRFALVFGQGRVEAFLALGQKSIPALLIEATDEDAFVMSLVENIARRNPHAAEQLESIRMLQQRGYDVATIARKTALDPTWVRGVLLLFGRGEVRLIQAVEAGRVPRAIAIAIVKADADGDGDGDEDAVQAVLQQPYENGDLRGSKMMTVRRLLEQRRNLGKAYERRGSGIEQPGLAQRRLALPRGDAFRHRCRGGSEDRQAEDAMRCGRRDHRCLERHEDGQGMPRDVHVEVGIEDCARDRRAVGANARRRSQCAQDFDDHPLRRRGLAVRPARPPRSIAGRQEGRLVRKAMESVGPHGAESYAAVRVCNTLSASRRG